MIKINSLKFSLIIVFSLLLVVGMSSNGLAAITSITIDSPNGGEDWSGTEEVTWTAVDCDPSTDYLNIQYTTGALYTTIATVPCSPETYNWDTTKVGDGTNYQIRIFLDGNLGINDNSDTTFTVDNINPTEVTNLVSTSHTIGTPSNNNMVDFSWTPADDVTSGLDGYSIVCDNNPTTLPDTTKDLEETEVT